MGLVDRIDMLAKALGHTLTSLERELGFGKSSIRKWDEKKPSCDKLLQVANFLSVSMDYLMTGDDSRLKPEEEALIHNWRQLDEDDKAIVKGKILECLRYPIKANTQNRADAYGKKAT